LKEKSKFINNEKHKHKKVGHTTGAGISHSCYKALGFAHFLELSGYFGRVKLALQCHAAP